MGIPEAHGQGSGVGEPKVLAGREQDVVRALHPEFECLSAPQNEAWSTEREMNPMAY